MNPDTLRPQKRRRTAAAGAQTPSREAPGARNVAEPLVDARGAGPPARAHEAGAVGGEMSAAHPIPASCGLPAGARRALVRLPPPMGSRQDAAMCVPVPAKPTSQPHPAAVRLPTRPRHTGVRAPASTMCALSAARARMCAPPPHPRRLLNTGIARCSPPECLRYPHPYPLIAPAASRATGAFTLNRSRRSRRSRYGVVG